jgi:hypothetical protein
MDTRITEPKNWFEFGGEEKNSYLCPEFIPGQSTLASSFNDLLWLNNT